MRIVLVIILSLFLQMSCRDVNTSTQAKDEDFHTSSNSKVKGEEGIKIQFLARNSPFVYDFVFSNGTVVGVGTGEKNRDDGLFVLNERTKSWDKQPVDSVTGSGLAINDITLENDDIWIAGPAGLIMKKGESDEHWRAMARIPVLEATLIDFADSRTAYIVSSAFNKRETGLRIFKTEDGGNSWKKVYENLIAGNPFDLAVIDANTVLIAMNDEYILRTENGGVTWQPIELEPTVEKIGSDDWIRLNRSGASDLEISSNICWVVGEKGSMYFSEDKGISWKRPIEMPVSVTGQSLRSIAFSPKGKGVSVGENGYILVSEDFGKTWNELSSHLMKETILKKEAGDGNENLHKVKFIEENAIILGKNGVYRLSF